MTPKQWIKYVKFLEKHNLAICDGATVEYHLSMFDILYPLFITTGSIIFITILIHWKGIKEKIFKK